LKAYLGIDIGGTNVKIAVVGRTGRVFARGVIDTESADGPRKTFRRIEAASRSLVALGRGVEVVAAGVGCAGLIDPVKGRLHSSPNLPAWENTPLKRIAERVFGVYTIVDNDANGAAYGEFRLGACRGVRHLVFITLGTGVGGGVVTDGRLLRGAANYAAEVGHTTISMDGPRCRCGNRGCLEAYVGTYGIVRSARELLRERKSLVLRSWIEKDGRRLTPQLVFEAARRRDAVANAVVRSVGNHLGVGVASLVNIFNPEAVVLGGGVAGSFDALRPHVERTVRRRAFAEPARIARVVPSVLGNDATAVGAAMLAMNSLDDRDREGKKSPG
jgi:glucokinase